ncbi:hypothetical protein Shyhy02_79230 [Streptomyces hygroscopicus subsp. hygroscopicus]|nr:hypothetical protein Shyhy02_79230 [Streptomyces hygroscopicus subsp. hygroscopicus]
MDRRITAWTTADRAKPRIRAQVISQVMDPAMDRACRTACIGEAFLLQPGPGSGTRRADGHGP